MYAAYTQATRLRDIPFGDTDIWPMGVALCGELVLVCDVHHHRVAAFRIDDGSFVRYVANAGGGAGSADGELNYPHNVAVHGDDGGADSVALVVDGGNGRVSMFRVSDGVFVRHLCDGDRVYHGRTLEPCGIAVYGDLALVTDAKNGTTWLFRIADGTLVRTMGDARGNWSTVAVYGNLALIGTSVRRATKRDTYWDTVVSVFRISDGVALRDIAIRGAADGMAVSGDVVIVHGLYDTRISAYRIADGTCAYHFDASIPHHSAPCGMAAAAAGTVLLVSDTQTCSVKLFRLPAAVRWQPDMDVHAQFCGALRGIVVATLAVASKAAASSLSRLPLELVCAVVSELVSV